MSKNIKGYNVEAKKEVKSSTLKVVENADTGRVMYSSDADGLQSYTNTPSEGNFMKFSGGVPKWYSIPYGGMYIYNLGAGGTTVTISSADVWYEITTGATGRTNNLITFQNNHELLITKAGVYKIDWTLAVGTLANHEIEGTVFINNTANTSFAGMSESTTANKSFSLSGTGHIALAANDVISLGVLNHTGANNVTIDHLTLSVVQIGG